MKRVWSLLCVVALLCLSLPFGAMAATEPTQTLNFSQMHGYYRSRGRTVEHNASLFMDNVAAGFEVYLYGSGDVVLNASVLCSTDNEIAQYLSVYVDGKLTRIRIACDQLHVTYDKSIVLASGLREGYHHIEVYRQTEAQTSAFRADTLTFTGHLLATSPESPLVIDVVGDSISGGYGCLWNSSLGVAAPTGNYPQYQDGTQTYAFLAGKALGADVRVLQSSGYGCVAGWNGRDVNLQTMYPLTNVFRSQTFTHTYDPLADIVIINLGTNDYNTRTANNITNAEFQAGAKNLMQMARQYNPGATVIWCTGMMGAYYTTEVKAAINELGGADAGYYFLQLPNGQGGAVSHPTAAQQAAAGDMLLNFLKTTVLPSDYTSHTASADQLRATINNARAVSNPSAALTGAITRAEAELAVGTTDPYRLYARMTAIQDAMAGDVDAVNLMPKQYISKTPTAADGVSYIWPYYGTNAVTMYKGGDGVYWPQLTTAQYQTIDIDETPYLRLDFAGTASFNVSLSYVTASGELASVSASTLANIPQTDFPARSRDVTTVDFGAYVRAQGHADSEGLVGLVGCDMFVIGSLDQYVSLYECVFTSRNDLPTSISGQYPVENGLLTAPAVGTTIDDLLAAMDHREQLIVVDANGNPASGVLATGMVLQLVQNGAVVDTATIIVRGDLDGDGNASSVDARMLLRELLGSSASLNELAYAASDFDDDGDYTTGDVRAILKATM